MDALSALQNSFPGSDAIRVNLADDNTPIKRIKLAELDQLNSANTAQATQPANASSFPSVLGNLVGEVVQKQAEASETVNGLLGGKNVSLHQAMISMQEANVSFQLMVEVRNKLLDSYQELMRMQV